MKKWECGSLKAVIGRVDAAAENKKTKEYNVSVVVPTDALGNNVYTILSEIQAACEPDTLEVHDKIAVVAAVGRRMAFRPGISGKIFAALGEAGINIRMINQGPDELNIIFGVDEKDFKQAIRVLYDSFAK